jgi:WD40 repeat protein
LRHLYLTALLAAFCAVGSEAAEPPAPVSFRNDVAPILVKHCVGCHSSKKAESGLNMATFALLRKGGKSVGAEILEPGDADASVLIEMVGPEGQPRMPYKLPPLPDADIQTLVQWVKQGAKFDGPSETETQIASLVDPLKGLPKIEVKVPASDPVTALAFSADGKTLAAGIGRSVVLFDPGSGKPTATLADLPGPVTAIRMTPDGKTLIAAGGRPGLFGSVTVWDLAARKMRFDLRGHEDSILAADLAPDGKTLATASYDRLIKLWDVVEGSELRTLKEHTDAVYAVAFSPDGRTLASAGADRTVKLWDLSTGQTRQSLSESTAELYALAFGPKSGILVAGGADRSIRVWALNDKGEAALSQNVVAHDAAIIRLVVSADGLTLYSSGEDKAVKVWDLPTLKPRSTWANQVDWPLALALRPDGAQLAVGRYDGSLALIDTKTGQPTVAVREAPGEMPAQPAAKPKPAFVRNASLNPPSPRGGVRGSKLRLTLSGTGVGQSTAVLFAEPGLSATIVPAEKPEENRLHVDLAIAADARVGVHHIGVQTPLGISPFQSFAVSAAPEVTEPEPKAGSANTELVPLPATLLGTIQRPGETDSFRFEVKVGQQLVFETVARALGSRLDATLRLLDESGRILAQADNNDTSADLDPLLTYQATRDATLTLRVVDAQFGGSGNHFYRIEAGTPPYVATIFPLGIERGQTGTINVSGLNLAGVTSVALSIPGKAEPGSLVTVPVTLPDGSSPWKSRSVVVAEGPQSVEVEANDIPGQANAVAVPAGISGRIGREGDVDHVRFEAKKGERLIVEVYGRRLGSPIDPVIEILDAEGRSIPRAVLRPVDETFVAFRDHGSAPRTIRLTEWDDLAIGDYILAGREVMRLSAMPRNPDDDAVFWGTGVDRTTNGERVAFLETTPEHHPMDQPMYKVEIHPPGTEFPAGGIPPVVLVYRNDDGGPGFSKDARLTFDPPADGTYIVRVEDGRGFGGDRYGYHLVIRRPHPDFQVTVSTDNPNVPRGGTTLLTANLTRIDGFDGPVDLTVDGLPPGITATSATFERETYLAEFLLMADESAPTTSAPTWHLTARARVGSAGSGEEIVHDIDPGGPTGGWVTVTPAADLKLAAIPSRVTIQPGQRVELTFAVERNPNFTGRVPIEVRNLPRGVRVMNIGLNGVLVTETQTERSVFLYAEPWAEPMERPFYASGQLEQLGKAMGGTGAPVIAKSREHVSPPIELIVTPSSTSPQASAGSER